MTPQELKNSILQLAIQGKLVEQRPEEGSAEPLYSQLKKEKELGIKKGSWGKSKSLTEIKNDEILFDIPDSWRWIKIGEISAVVTKGTTPRGGNVSYLEKGIGFLRAENVAGFDKLDKSNLKCIDDETHFGFLKRSILKADDILITIAGTLGRTAIVRDFDIPLNVNQAISIVRLVNTNNISLTYLIYAINSPEIQTYLTGQKKITAIPNLTLEIIENCLIPLPSLAEQKRIVAKIEELMPLVDRYEKAWNQLKELNKRFPEDMQKALLQWAIQGKLVEQRPEEGTGEELYQKIQAEKARLVKAGKSKKEKPLPKITEDEVPFEIPESWKWVRLDELVIKSIKRGKSPVYTSKSNTLVFAQKCNTKAGYIDLSLALYLDENKLDKYPEDEFIQDKDIIINSTGNGTLGRVGIYRSVDNPNNLQIVPDSHVTVIRANKSIYFGYVFYGLKHYQQYLEKLGSGSTNQTELSAGIIKSLLFPLPPLAEQKRIVAKLEELLPLCERLK